MAIRRRRPGFRRFRRNRTKATWFPILGNTYDSEDGFYADASFNIGTPGVPATLALGPSQSVYAITKDFTQIPSATAGQTDGPSLRDYVEGQTYLLQRIVGNVHLQCVSNQPSPPQPNDWPYIKVAAAFFVARADDEDQTIPSLSDEECDPWNADNIQNPWIWRRTWMLNNPNTSHFGLATFDWPNVNSEYPADCGPHIDSKVKRAIRREQRLWFVLSARGWDGNNVTQGNFYPPYVRGVLDVRLVGTLRRSKNASSF